jgi:hypothetical protein
MAEIILKSWKNAGVFGSIVNSFGDVVTCQATFIDFEDLTMVSKPVERRVTGSHGDARQLAVMSGIAIASRNAILGGIPRAFWQEAYEKAKAVAAGSLETLEKRRADAIDWLAKNGVAGNRIFAALDIDGISDVGLEELALLRTLVNQVRGGDMTLAQAFPDPDKNESDTKARGTKGVKENLGVGKEAGPADRPA